MSNLVAQIVHPQGLATLVVYRIIQEQLAEILIYILSLSLISIKNIYFMNIIFF